MHKSEDTFPKETKEAGDTTKNPMCCAPVEENRQKLETFVLSHSMKTTNPYKTQHQRGHSLRKIEV